MTAQDIEASLRALGVGWDIRNRGFILEQTPTAACNPMACESYARIGTDAGATADDVALAIYASEFGGDGSALGVILQAAADVRGA